MFERPRGTNDWGPEDMAKRRFGQSRFIQCAESFGSREALALGIGTMRAIGLRQVKARIGNIGILRGFLPFAPSDQAVVLHSLDKRNFPMLDAELARLGRPDLSKLLRALVELSGDAPVLDKAARILEGAGSEGFEYLQKIADLLDA